MKIEIEIDLLDFAYDYACQEVTDILHEINTKDLIHDLEECIYEFFPSVLNADRLQEYLLNRNEVAEDLGFENWDHLENTFEYVADQVRAEISEDDLDVFESVTETDLEDFLEDNYSIDNLKDIKEIILDIKERINDM